MRKLQNKKDLNRIENGTAKSQQLTLGSQRSASTNLRSLRSGHTNQMSIISKADSKVMKKKNISELPDLDVQKDIEKDLLLKPADIKQIMNVLNYTSADTKENYDHYVNLLLVNKTV